MEYNFKPLNFYYKLPTEIQEKYFDDVDYGNRTKEDVEAHSHTASLFFRAVLTMDNETYHELDKDNDNVDGRAIKEAAIFFADPFHRVIMKHGLYEKYPEYVV